VIVAAGVVTSLVAVGQEYIGNLFIQLWRLTGGQEGEFTSIDKTGRMPGLATTVTGQSLYLIQIIPLCFYLLITTQNKFKKRSLFVFIAVMIWALLLTEVRSSIFAILVFSTAIFLTANSTSSGVKVISATLVASVLVLGSIVYFGGFDIGLSKRLLDFTDTSSQVRLPMYRAAFTEFSENPLFGSGVYAPSKSSLSSNLSYREQTAILDNTSHNQFLNTLVYYGIGGITLLVAFYSLILRLVLKTRRAYKMTGATTMRLFTTCMFVSVGSYVVSTFFHNAGPFIGDMFHWYIIGIIMAIGTKYNTFKTLDD